LNDIPFKFILKEPGLFAPYIYRLHSLITENNDPGIDGRDHNFKIVGDGKTFMPNLSILDIVIIFEHFE
jgi:hypothetical protein